MHRNGHCMRVTCTWESGKRLVKGGCGGEEFGG